MDYQKQMLALHLKANPKEVLVGWYATSSELNTFSALIQNFYGGQGDGTWPWPAVHLTVGGGGEDGEIDVAAYVSSPVGVTAERAADSAAFIPVPHQIRYGETEKSGLEIISSAKDREDRTVGVLTDIEALERLIEDTLGMLDRVAKYVEAVIEEEAPPSTALGQFLLNTLALAPKVDAADIERDLYGILFLLGKSLSVLTLVQQQPYPRCSRRLISCQYDTNPDGFIKSTCYSTANNGRGRWPRSLNDGTR
jgi:translation initiation factor 3 subunit F